MSLSFFEEAHTRFISNLGKDKETFEYCVTEHLRMSGVYWGLTAMDLMGRRHEMPCDEIVEWVMKCGHPNGGFGGNISHDPHLLYTLSAIQILAILDELGRLDFDLVAPYVAGLQQADGASHCSCLPTPVTLFALAPRCVVFPSKGSFAGDMWGEVDTRFSYCAVSCLSILGRMDVIDVDKAMRYLVFSSFKKKLYLFILT
jgi:geranylgeranyl transferase type-2 subunit beta